MKIFLLNVIAVTLFVWSFNATEVFANFKVKSATVGTQQGNSEAGTAGDVMYTIDIACAGNGTDFSTVNISGSGLPSGATAIFSSGTFSVIGKTVILDYSAGNIILTIHSDGTIPADSYSGISLTFTPENYTTSAFTYLVENPVPVELTSFSGSVNNNVVLLKWATATEVNNYGFVIERSSSSFGTSWKKIGFVNGYGNSNSPKEYSYKDKNLKSGSYSYRLKQMDNDGSYDYSNTIEFNLGLPVTLELKQNYPNPFNPSTTINFSIPKSGNVSLKIYNSIGEEIATLINEYMEAGEYNFNYKAEDLPSGFYVYQLRTGESSLTKKMLLLK